MGVISLEILENDDQITAHILRALASDLTKRLHRSKIKLLPKLKRLLRSALQSQPEYFSLLNGDLMAEFGLVDGQERIDRIIEHWLNTISIKVIPVRARGKKLTGGLKITAIPSDYSDVEQLPEAVFVTEKGHRLEWLSWLLKNGDQAIILEYTILYGNFTQSRTGRAIMNKKFGGRWSVPPEYAGTINNNFVTRTIESIGPQIESTIIQTVSSDI